jgi:hypothetical protein
LGGGRLNEHDLVPEKSTMFFSTMFCLVRGFLFLFTLWLFNIAMENGPFIDGLPIKNGDFPWLC